MKFIFLFFGILFGFLLSRGGATTFDMHARLFLFENFQLLWVIASAVSVGIIGVLILKWLRARALLLDIPLQFEGKAMRRYLAPGALLFGVGWGLTGSCPGTAPVMLGEGKLATLFTLGGIFLGTYVYGILAHRKRQAVCVSLTPSMKVTS
ncbi:MAG: YeeE/YedE family protein [Gammaproteobacteria bacterium]|nr:YeeE/YedE family protein [Gammaproteobacteria bacterium]